jgi:hypothetical protein
MWCARECGSDLTVQWCMVSVAQLVELACCLAARAYKQRERSCGVPVVSFLSPLWFGVEQASLTLHVVCL